MKTIEYFRGVMKEAHKGLGAAVKDLTDAQLHFRPLEAGHSIAFTLWHYVRTEDIMIHVCRTRSRFGTRKDGTRSWEWMPNLREPG